MDRTGVSPANTDLLTLGIDGFAYADLYSPERLKALNEVFAQVIQEKDPALFSSFHAYQNNPEQRLSPPEESELLVQVGVHLSEFISKLFNIGNEREALIEKVQSIKPIFRYKKMFVQKRVLKKYTTEDLVSLDYETLNDKVRLLIEMMLGEIPAERDREEVFAEVTCRLLDAEKSLSDKIGRNEPIPEAILQSLSSIQQNQSPPESSDPEEEDLEVEALYPELVGGPFDESQEAELLEFVQQLLTLVEKWTFAAMHLPEGGDSVKKWDAFTKVHKIDFSNLVEIVRPNPEAPELIIGPEERYRRRDGFKLTDGRFSEKQALSEIDYCVICHPREKDSCRTGLRKKKSEELDKNPLGIELTGCPLDERISEMNVLQGEGDAIAALAVIIIDNPMAPATGHRICNDCMKGCIYQKKDPVNIPQIETRILTDVLDLPYGFEIYSLLTRWNPLNRKRPYALPYNGKKVLVVGMGPAGFTLAQFLLNEGFGVVGVDGLKIEPLPERLVGNEKNAPEPVRDVTSLYHELDERILAGFGGVAEYGITVRWDKNFLDLIHLTLARRDRLEIFGGTRFGGTITVEKAWDLGFDHIAIAAGAGKPTILWMKNNLIRGVRKASDFLMALQLTGASKKSSMANLQLRLPAIVIGGGLTAIDTATEAMAYYPVQVEKTLDYYEKLSAEKGEASILSMYDEEEKEILQEFLEHGRCIRAERERAAREEEDPDFIPLLRSWGGISLIYRRDVLNSPAYRLNHEEIIKSLEEGIYYVELQSPTEIIPDQYGAAKAVKFEKQVLTGGKLRGSGEFVEHPAKAVLVAAGTSPNIIYEKEHPGTFEMDGRKKFFKRFQPSWDEASETPEIPMFKASDDWTAPAVFTSYSKEGKYITFYGDNHPVYAGNVVRAMASAREGFSYITRLFQKELAQNSSEGQVARDAEFKSFTTGLDDILLPTVVDVVRLTPTIIEVIVKAPIQAQQFKPGQFYRLQNYEVGAEVIDGISMSTEGIALTGAWVDKEQGLLSLITLEMGVSSRLCAALKPGDPVVVMGPTGEPTEILTGETVLLAGGGLGNAVLFSIGKAMRAKGNKVIYFAAYKKPEDVYKVEEIEAASDQIVWSVDAGTPISPGRPQDLSFVGNIVEAMLSYAKGELGETPISLKKVDRIIAIGSDRMMEAVKNARHNSLAPYLNPDHVGIGSINSPMQCMMKEICGQCLQKHVDPETGEEVDPVFSCFNQDQKLDCVDFQNLRDRLKQNSIMEKMSNRMLDLLMKQKNIMRV